MSNTHTIEIKSGERFEFGSNWAKFLDTLDERRIRMAEQSMRDMLGVQDLKGKTFLDIGSGSGLLSLVARRLGAKVVSFDFDPQSVACTAQLKRQFFTDDPQWTVREASVLDAQFMKSLGQFDIVYSWGVLHHTGSMWKALDHAAALVVPHGKLFIAIYNDQGGPSRRWLKIKKAYNKLPHGLKWIVLWPMFIRIWGRALFRDLLKGKPFYSWRKYPETSLRGMSAWRDVVDWVGGLPFEVAKPEEIFEFHQSRGFELQKMVTCAGGLGCNEFVFVKKQQGDGEK